MQDVKLIVFCLLSILVAAQQVITDLMAGQVFALMTLNPSVSDVNEKIVTVYGDATMGIQDPYNVAQEFHGVYMPEYGIVLQPDPLQCVKFTDRNIFLVNDSLWNTGYGFQAENTLLVPQQNARTVVCPSWNHVLLLDDGNAPVCDDSIPVDLQLIHMHP